VSGSGRCIAIAEQRNGEEQSDGRKKRKERERMIRERE